VNLVGRGRAGARRLLTVQAGTVSTRSMTVTFVVLFPLYGGVQLLLGHSGLEALLFCTLSASGFTLFQYLAVYRPSRRRNRDR